MLEAEGPHLEIISPPGLLGLKEEARRNVVEILEKPESRSSDSSFTEALRFYTAERCMDPSSSGLRARLFTLEDVQTSPRISRMACKGVLSKKQGDSSVIDE